MRNTIRPANGITYENGARIRGSIVAARLAYVTTHWGDAGRRLLLSKLSAKDRKRAQSIALDGDWFDYATLELLDRTIVNDLAGGDGSILRELGRASAEYNLERLKQARLSDLDVRTTIERVGRMNLFQDFGGASSEPLENGIALTYRYPSEVTGIYCESALGFFEGLLVALGCEEPRVAEASCQARDGHSHRYELRWREPRGRSEAVHENLASPDDLDPPEKPGESIDHDRKLDGAVAALYRNVFATSARPVGTDAAPRGITRERRVVALVAFAVILASLALARLISAIEPSESTLRGEPIRHYVRNGDLALELRFDSPSLRLTTSAPLADVTITIHQFGKAYALSVASIPGDAFLEAELGSFTAADGTNPDAAHAPAYLTIGARSDGKIARSEYRLE